MFLLCASLILEIKVNNNIKNCPCCRNEAVSDFEEHMIYCTGCSLSVQDTSKDLKLLTNEWNLICESICKNLAKTKGINTEFIKLIDDEFWDLI